MNSRATASGVRQDLRLNSSSHHVTSGPSRHAIPTPFSYNTPSGGRSGNIESSGNSDATVDTEFDFLIARYPNVGIIEKKKVAARMNTRNAKNVVYFNRDIRCGRKLIIRVESVSQPVHPNIDYGLIFGVTSCPPAQVTRMSHHLINVCRPEFDCCGVSVTKKLWKCDRVGNFVVVERLFDAFIQLTINNRGKLSMSDPEERGFGRERSYPFIVLNGIVESVRILSEVPPEAPAPIPRFRYNDTNYSVHCWLLNYSIKVNGTIMKRESQNNTNRNYIFGKQPFSLGQSIGFQIKEFDESIPGTITFGVTTYEPNSICFENLPKNCKELSANRFGKNWYLSQDIIASGSSRQAVSLKKTPDGITIKVGPKKPWYLFYVDPTLIAYPFFNFNGAVRSIELVINSAAVFDLTSVGRQLQLASRRQTNGSSSSSSTEGKCVICLGERADHMAVPCNHVAFCASCSSDIMSLDLRKCPLCREDISRISKIFLA